MSGRYEGKERGNKRFYEIRVDDRSLVVTSGLCDGSRKPATKKEEWANKADATKQGEKLIAKLLENGFRLAGKAKAPPKSATAKAAKKVNHRVFLDEILDDRDDPTAYLVYADALQAAGDPRGELIVVQEARARKPNDRALVRAEDALLDANYKQWVDRAVDHQDTKALTLEWKYGFVSTASIREVANLARAEQSDIIVKDLFACSSAALLDSLLIESYLDWRFGEIAHAIAKSKNRPPIRTLRLSKNRRGGPSSTIDANELLRAFPQLRCLILDGQVETLDDERLRLTHVHIERPSPSVAALLKKKWPGLEKVTFGKSWKALS